MKAFPYKGWNGHETAIYEGMDLRDYFASKVAQAILTGSAWNISEPTEVAKKAYQYADAMIIARKEHEQGT